MLRLLHEFPQRGYPGEYLLARLRGRRGRLLAEDHAEAEEGLPGHMTGDTIRHKEQQERRWLFRQMDDRLRLATAPLFFYVEINPLIQCLRFIEAGQAEESDSLLEGSLLSGELKNTLRAATSVPQAVDGMERMPASPPALKGLGRTYQEIGIRGCDESIRALFLQQTLRARIHPAVRSFFLDLVHLRNTMTLAKCLRWQRDITPDLIVDPGTGRIKALPVSEKSLRHMAGRLLRREDLSAEDLRPVNLEALLLAAQQLKMNRCRRTAGDVAVCIEYVLRVAVIAGKRRIRLQTRQPAAGGQPAGEAVY